MEEKDVIWLVVNKLRVVLVVSLDWEKVEIDFCGNLVFSLLRKEIWGLVLFLKLLW